METDFRDRFFLSSRSGSFFSAGVDAVGAPATAFPKSKAVPGVFGVLVADPKEAKAPEPKPKALEPAIVGEDMPLVVRGVTVLKGLLRP